MIDTIFYFANNQDEYSSKAVAGEINPRTISFVPKGTSQSGTIYKAGVRYGGIDEALDYAAIKAMIIRAVGETPNIVAPTVTKASKDTYGIVKIGSGIRVEDGVISADFSNIDMSEIEDDITSLKASVGSYGNAITDLTQRIASAETGLFAKVNASDVYTKTEVDGKIATVVQEMSGNAGLDLSTIVDLQNGLTEVRAALSAKANATETYTKTEVDNRLTSIETTVATLGASSGVDTSAITDLVNRVSTAESSLASKANASEIYTKEEVDGKISTVETQMTTLGSSSGLSNTAITDLKNRMSSAESSLTSKANALNVYTKTEVDNKFTTVNATLETLGALSGVDTSAITDLTNRVAAAETSLQSKANSNNVYTKTEIDGKITTINSSISANSGLKTAADVKSAFNDVNETIYTSGTASATLFAKIESDADAKYAGIDVAVKKINVGTTENPEYLLESDIKISADNISIGGSRLNISQLDGRPIDFNSSYGLAGTISESYSWDSPQSNQINISNNSIILGSVSGDNVNVDGLIASRIMFTGNLSVGVLHADNIDWLNKLDFRARRSDSYTEDFAIILHGDMADDGYEGGPKSIALNENCRYYIGAKNSNLYNLTVEGDLTSARPVTVSSDERLKTIHSLVTPNISDIASARIADFTYNNDEKNKHYVGILAQDWLNIIPQAVTENKDGYYSVNYSAICSAASITAAREIVRLKEENIALRERMEALETRLQLIENKLNA